MDVLLSWVDVFKGKMIWFEEYYDEYMCKVNDFQLVVERFFVKFGGKKEEFLVIDIDIIDGQVVKK